MRNGISAVIGGALLGALALAGQASAEDWVVQVGGQVNAAPPYEGAGYDLVLPLPTIGIRRADQPERPAISGDAPGIAVINKSWISFGPDLRLRGSRDDTGLREGLTTVGVAAEPGLFLSLWPIKWVRLHAEQRRGILGYDGWVGDGALDFVAQAGSWGFTAGPRIGWGGRSYMNTYFGVTSAEAAASPVIDTPYSPRGGERYLGGGGAITYRFNSHWEAIANVGYHRLSSIAADSPIIMLIGSRDEYSGGIAVKYNFTLHR